MIRTSSSSTCPGFAESSPTSVCLRLADRSLDAKAQALVAAGIAERLAARRTERRELEVRLSAAQALAHEQPVEPTIDWVREQVRQLAGKLTDPTPAAAYALRDLLDGPIRVRQIERAGKKRHFLRGTLRIRLGTLAAALAGTDRQIEQAALRVRDGEEAHSASARQSPDLPPVFSMRRMSRTIMPLSSAFAMS